MVRPNPLRAAIPPFQLTETLLQQVTASIALSDFVWQRQAQNDEVTWVFQDMNDRALVQYHAGTCYAVFKGAWAGNPSDFLQSFPMPAFLAKDVCGAAGCCSVERGMYMAYYSDYVMEFEAAVAECYNWCDGGCPVVITGHSQGAAIAPVAAIALAAYNPILLTFGQHMTQIGDCGVLENMETYLRFNAMCSVMGGPSYDTLAAWGNFIRGKHSGTHILLGHGGAATLGYNTDMILFPFQEKCHNIFDPYMESIQRLTPGPMNGFVEGSMCTRHIECQSRRCERKRCIGTGGA